MAKQECELARRLLQNAQAHDASKFAGIEWEFLTIGNTSNKIGLKYAIEQHQRSNAHHPEYWAHGITEMPLVQEYEMIADLAARSNEMGTSVRDYVNDVIPKKYNIPSQGELHKELIGILDMLVNKPFEDKDSSTINVASQYLSQYTEYYDVNDLTGKKIGIFTVLGREGRMMPSKAILWSTVCPICYKPCKFTRHMLKRYKSCGCLQGKRLAKDCKCWKGIGDMSKSYYNTVVKNAKQRGLVFKLTMQQIWDLYIKQDKKCALTGEIIIFPSKFSAHDGTASLDRRDSSKGYTLDNVQWVHKVVNFMKQQFSEKEFIEWCNKISKYNE